MAKYKDKDQDTQPPRSFPQTTPPIQSLGQIDVGQMVFELQASVSKLENSYTHLEKNVDKGFGALQKALDDHHKILDGIRRILWIVTGGAIVAGIVAGFAIEHGLDKIAAFFTK